MNLVLFSRNAEAYGAFYVLLAKVVMEDRKVKVQVRRYPRIMPNGDYGATVRVGDNLERWIWKQERWNRTI